MATGDSAYLLRDLTRDLLLVGRLWRKMAREAAARHGVSEAASAPLIWIERLGESNLLVCFVEPAQRHEARHRVPMPRGRIPRVQLHRLLKQRFGAAEIPVLRRSNMSKGRVRFRRMAVEHHR